MWSPSSRCDRPARSSHTQAWRERARGGREANAPDNPPRAAAVADPNGLSTMPMTSWLTPSTSLCFPFALSPAPVQSPACWCLWRTRRRRATTRRRRSASTNSRWCTVDRAAPPAWHSRRPAGSWSRRRSAHRRLGAQQQRAATCRPGARHRYRDSCCSHRRATTGVRPRSVECPPRTSHVPSRTRA